MALPNIVATGRHKLFPEGRGKRLIEVARTLGASVELDVVIHDQQRGYWCWAASAAGIATAYGKRTSQCAVASMVFSALKKKTVVCCANRSRSDCDKPQRFKLPLRLVGHLDDFIARPFNNALTAIRTEINQGTPIGIRIGFTTSRVGHLIVVHGYDVDASGDPHVLIGDPSSSTAVIPLATLIRGYRGHGFWHSTYTTRGPRPVPRK